MHGKVLELEANTVVFREGEPPSELYFLQAGKVLVCTLDGTKVKVITRISAGEFIGELSFFDGKPRASSVVTLEKSKLIRIDTRTIEEHLPKWYSQVGQALTKKIRLLDQVIHSSNIRISRDEETKPLSLQEQRLLYNLLTNQNA